MNYSINCTVIFADFVFLVNYSVDNSNVNYSIKVIINNDGFVNITVLYVSH